MTAFFKPAAGRDPRSQISLSRGLNAEVAGGTVDFDAILRSASWHGHCPECGVELEHWDRSMGARFCSTKHRYAFRDARKYAEDPEGQRARSRAYYLANRERILGKAAAKRGGWERPAAFCSECSVELVGRQRITCGKSSCREARFRRLHPDAYAAREAAKVERRRARRLAQRGDVGA